MMRKDRKTIALILPARNEAPALPSVLEQIPAEVDYVIVADNGSTDTTAQIAKDYGAIVVHEEKAGYGAACLSGIKMLKAIRPDIVAFADADGSDAIARLCELVDPIADGHADLVIERRIPVNPGALTHQQRFGNWLATSLIRLLWGHAYTDLGPMRAIKWSSLIQLDMKDKNYGWTVEMQIKALKTGLRIMELPLPYLKRAAGRSKVSRTLRGTAGAGIKILWIILRETISDSRISSNKNRQKVTKDAA